MNEIELLNSIGIRLPANSNYLTAIPDVSDTVRIVRAFVELKKIDNVQNRQIDIDDGFLYCVSVLPKPGLYVTIKPNGVIDSTQRILLADNDLNGVIESGYISNTLGLDIGGGIHFRPFRNKNPYDSKEGRLLQGHYQGTMKKLANRLNL